MRKLPFIPLLFSIFLLFITASCKDDDDDGLDIIDNSANQAECEALSNFGDLLLLEESKNFIPYLDDISKLIFSDSLGKEYVGVVSSYAMKFGNGSSSPSSACPIDSSILVTYDWSYDYKEAVILFDELDIKIDLDVEINLASGPAFREGLFSDWFRMVLYHPITATKPSSQMTIVVDQRTDPMANGSYTDFKEELEIHQVKFNKVYIEEPVSDDENFDLFYSGDHGIVGFKSKDDNSIDLKFVRAE